MSLQDKRQGSPKRHRPHVAHRRTSLGGGPEVLRVDYFCFCVLILIFCCFYCLIVFFLFFFFFFSFFLSFFLSSSHKSILLF